MSPSDERTFTNSDKTYIIWGYNDIEQRVDGYTVASGTYVVLGPKADAVNQTLTFLRNAFDDYHSADNINAWANSSSNSLSPRISQTLITHTYTSGVLGAMAPDTEDGFWDGTIEFEFGYKTPDYNFSIK